MPGLEEMLTALFAQATVIGFGGSRDPGNATRLVVERVRGLVPDGKMVHVGDAPGVDAMIRWAFDDSRRRTFFVKDYGPVGARYAYAKRSTAVIESLNVPGGGLWVSFPDKPCPDGILPAAEARAVFIGTGNGSWPSLAYAIGLGQRDKMLRSLLYLPSPLQPPPQWRLRPLDEMRGWWLGQWDP